VNRALLSSESSAWRTPWNLWHALDRQFAFTLDACASADNAKHPRFFSEKDNGLAQSWEGETAWVNPPYGRALPSWVERTRNAAIDENAIAVELVPFRPDTAWWRDFVMQADGAGGPLRRAQYLQVQSSWVYEWRRLRVQVWCYPGRVSFGKPAGSSAVEETAPFPTAIVIVSSPSRRPARARRSTEEVDPLIPLLTAGWAR